MQAGRGPSVPSLEPKAYKDIFMPLMAQGALG
jgi:hypothetical protein